jgi:hypothetical protein
VSHGICCRFRQGQLSVQYEEYFNDYIKLLLGDNNDSEVYLLTSPANMCNSISVSTGFPELLNSIFCNKVQKQQGQSISLTGQALALVQLIALFHRHIPPQH